MSRRPLAARFDDFDDEEAARQAAYLDAQAATRFWRERKRIGRALLELRAGMAVLDVGCGTGDDVRAIAAEVGPDGEAVGVDASRALVAEAVRRSTTDQPVSFHVADAAALPFEAGRFDAVRCERVLQHVADPVAALAEMARVGRPGARVVAIEPDWDTFTIEGEPFEVTQAVCRRWASAIRQPRVGRDLPALMAAAGLVRVEARVDTSLLSDLAHAREQFALDELAGDAIEAGEVAAEEAERWLEDLRERAATGRFEAGVSYVTARAAVP